MITRTKEEILEFLGINPDSTYLIHIATRPINSDENFEEIGEVSNFSYIEYLGLLEIHKIKAHIEHFGFLNKDSFQSGIIKDIDPHFFKET